MVSLNGIMSKGGGGMMFDNWNNVNKQAQMCLYLLIDNYEEWCSVKRTEELWSTVKNSDVLYSPVM